MFTTTASVGSRLAFFLAPPLVRWAVLLFLGSGAQAGLKIACVGDSITEGAGLSNPTTESYPAKLQRLVGTNHVVRNYGVSGRTLLKKGDYPYWKEAAYTQSRAWEPDVVVIKLGTNDSKPYNWRYSTNFVGDFEEFIASYRSLPSHPRVVLCTPAPVFAKGAFDINPGTVATNIAPAVRDMVNRLGLELIDFHTRLAGYAPWFPDTVHPNSKGTTVMAAIVLESLGLVSVSPDPVPLQVAITPLTSRRVRLEWPASLGAWVLEAATGYSPTGSVAAAPVEQPAYSDGTILRVTNSATATARFYRLWKPQ